MAPAYALLASLCWGVGDFLGGIKSRVMPALVVMGVSQPFGLAALAHDIGRTRELGPPPLFQPTEEGKLLGHVHLGLRMLEDAGAPTELLHAVACHHDVRAARTAEAAVLYHANQLDAVAATRPVD